METTQSYIETLMLKRLSRVLDSRFFDYRDLNNAISLKLFKQDSHSRKESDHYQLGSSNPSICFNPRSRTESDSISREALRSKGKMEHFREPLHSTAYPSTHENENPSFPLSGAMCETPRVFMGA